MIDSGEHIYDGRLIEQFFEIFYALRLFVDQYTVKLVEWHDKLCHSSGYLCLWYINRIHIWIDISFRFDLGRIVLKMSKLSVVFFVAFAVALVSAQEPKVLREKNINDGSGTFEFTYASFTYQNRPLSKPWSVVLKRIPNIINSREKKILI